MCLLLTLMGNTPIQGIYSIYSVKHRKSRQLKFTAKKSLAALRKL